MCLKLIVFSLILIFINCPFGERLVPTQSQCKKTYQRDTTGFVALKNRSTPDNPVTDEEFISSVLLATEFYKDCLKKAKRAEGPVINLLKGD